MKNLLIDTHAHINFKDFKDDAKDVIKRSLDESIWMINVGAESKTSERAVKIAEEYEKGVYWQSDCIPVIWLSRRWNIRKTEKR